MQNKHRFFTTFLLFLLPFCVAAEGKEFTSPTEGVITNAFVGEQEMKQDLLGMLARFSEYMVCDFEECKAPNSLGEACGCFRGEHTMANDERGVRPNADLSMICAFLVKYAKPAGVALPAGITWEKIEDIAMKSLVFAYSTHKANRLKVCSGNNFWGSTSANDNTWESSLWAMSVAYSAFFQWDKLTEAQRGYIYNMLKAECNYELERTIPTGYRGDTKAEENGWEVNVLAATLGLFPNDELSPRWFERMREFAVNSYSHVSDGCNYRVIDPHYDEMTVAKLYRGENLYEDYTLQNHNLFHTSYQNVVMQELGEAALALKMFQKGIYGEEKWWSNSLMHNNQAVQDNVLNWLALADGELAMPNGNDWSLFLYDQITSYTTQACFQKDANALMLENLAYKYIMARQQTTPDGSWLLRADVGARRMGVQGHRVMMTYLMHDVASTATLTPTRWEDFRKQHSEARLLPCQDVIRAYTPQKFSCFSWSKGLRSYTGYFTSDKPDVNKIIVPFRANNTGNIIGWYEVEGKRTDAVPSPDFCTDGKGYTVEFNGDAYTLTGELITNEGSLRHRFMIVSTPGNALLYMDHVTALKDCIITAEKGGMLAISTDELMKVNRTLTPAISETTDGIAISDTRWLNIDNEISVVSLTEGKQMAFGDRTQNNSIFTSKLYPLYNNKERKVKAGDVVDNRCLIYYTDATVEKTIRYAKRAKLLPPNKQSGTPTVQFIDDKGNYKLNLITPQ